MKILIVKDEVERLLLNFPACREDDNRLIVSIWAKQLGDDKINEMSAVDLLNMISDGKLPSPETIRRIRQKLQELYPVYRGNNYKQRNAEQEKVINDLKTV